MGRLFLVAGVAILLASGIVHAKPHPSKGAGRDQVRVELCPPGLQYKNNRCMPPGRYKKLFEIGQRVPAGYKGVIRYDALPYDVRMSFGGALDPNARYIYDQNYIYRVDPKTMIVRQVLRPLL